MDTLVSSFHIDVKLLIAQIINFVIVFGVLFFFALKPVTKILRDREKTIEKSLQDAKDIEEKLFKANQESQQIVDKAKKDALLILSEAEKKAEEKRVATVDKTKLEIGELINKEKENIRREKEEVMKEMKSEVVGLVVATAEKFLGEKVDAHKDAEIIKNSIK